MKRFVESLGMISCLFFLTQCGDTTSSSTGASKYADFGETLSNVVPVGLKTGSVTSSSILFKNALSGTCNETFTGCPNLVDVGGADSMAGEILSRLWAIDYDNECTAAFLNDGTCFACAECNNGSVSSNYIKPTLLATPTSCASTSTTKARYVNFGVDPCFFDKMIGEIDNLDSCMEIEGEAVDISSAVPWYASWGIPKTIHFSGYHMRSSGGLWWTVSSGLTTGNRYFISVEPDWLYGGVKDVTNDQFIFFGSGSPAYYAGRGEGSGINIAGYAGSIKASTKFFEAIQVRDQPPYSYIHRMKSNGTHLWAQYWDTTNFPTTPAAAESVKNTPASTRCVQIGTSVVTSKYVPLSDCVTSFGVASVDALNQDSFYVLKIVDGQTAGAIKFTTPLTSTSQSSCMKPETATQ